MITYRLGWIALLHAGDAGRRFACAPCNGQWPTFAQRAEFRWANAMLGNLKTPLARTYHLFDHTKYAARYLAEFSYRFNRRFDLASMLARLLRAAVMTKPLPFGGLALI
jgi:hypothetical protein